MGNDIISYKLNDEVGDRSHHFVYFSGLSQWRMCRHSQDKGIPGSNNKRAKPCVQFPVYDLIDINTLGNSAQPFCPVPKKRTLRRSELLSRNVVVLVPRIRMTRGGSGPRDKTGRRTMGVKVSGLEMSQNGGDKEESTETDCRRHTRATSGGPDDFRFLPAPKVKADDAGHIDDGTTPHLATTSLKGKKKGAPHRARDQKINI